MSNPKKGVVLINGRTVVHKESGGVLITTDVCLTKIGKSTVPIPYTNVARSVDAENTSSTVFVNGHPICHKKSIFSKSTGDEPGTRLGIRSGTITGKAEFITGSPNVFIEGIPAVRQGDMMVSNNCNTAPMPLSQPGAPIARTFNLSQVTQLEETELPDKVVLGQSGEQAQLLRGLYRGNNGSNTAKVQRIFQYIEQEGAERYRELLSNNLEAGTQHLSLLFNDKEFDSTDEEDKEYIVIPLGHTKTVKKDSPHPRSPEEFANFTVPIIPKRYTTTEFDKAKTADLRSGWLYIYRNGYLWRELQVRQSSFMADVNLRRHQGQNTRPASGESDSRVIVPWKIDNQLQTIEIAFSEVQWSWARINALGGMEPDKTKELRLKDTTPMPILPASETAKNRRERMQDITDELGQWLRGAGQDTENIQSAENVTAEIFTMLLHKNSKMPVLFLQDPLGIALDNGVAVLQGYNELTALMKTISEKPFYQSAVLAYRLFFDPKTAYKGQDQRPEIRSAIGCHGADTATKTIFGKCAEFTDEDKLKELLEVDKRRELRVKIRDLKKTQVDFLQGIHNNQPISRPDFIDVNTAMVDYFSCEGYRYFESWQSIIGITANLDVDPCAIDGSLLLSNERDRPAYEEDQGCRYLETLLEPSHPLHAMLFPTEQQAPVESDGPVQEPDPPNDGLGGFRSVAFAAAVRGNIRTPGLASQEVRRLAALAEQSVHDFLARFSKQWQQAGSWETSFDIKALTRLSKVASDDLVGLRIMPLGKVTEEFVIVHANIGNTRNLSTSAAHKKLRNSKNASSAFKIVDDANNIIASQNIRLLSKFKGIPIGSDWKWTDVAKLNHKRLKISQLSSVDVNVTVIPKESALAYKLKHMEADLGTGVAAQAKSVHAIQKTLPPVVVLFEIWNLYSVTTAMQASEGRKQVEIASAYADLSYATLQGITKVFNKEGGVGEKIAKAAYRTAKGQKILHLPLLGSVAAFGSAAISLLDTFDKLGENDIDSAVGHGIAFAGFALMGFSLLGASAKFSIFAALAPYLWFSLGVVLIGVIIANTCNNSPIEVWAANGPFCEGKGDKKFQYLREISQDQLAYNSLINCLFTPRIEISRLTVPVFNESQKGDIRVKVYLPNFTVDQDEVDVRTYYERAEEINCITNKVESWSPQTHTEPYIVKQYTTDLQVTAMEYFYHAPMMSDCRWAAKARIIMAKGPILPDSEYPQDAPSKGTVPEKPVQKTGESDTAFLQRYEEYQTNLNTIFNKAIPGWVYAELS